MRRKPPSQHHRCPNSRSSSSPSPSELGFRLPPTNPPTGHSSTPWTALQRSYTRRWRPEPLPPAASFGLKGVPHLPPLPQMAADTQRKTRLDCGGARRWPTAHEADGVGTDKVRASSTAATTRPRRSSKGEAGDHHRRGWGWTDQIRCSGPGGAGVGKQDNPPSGASSL